MEVTNAKNVGGEFLETLQDNFFTRKIGDESESIFSATNSYSDRLIRWLISVHYIPLIRRGQQGFLFKIVSTETCMTVFLFSVTQAILFSLQIATFVILLEYSFNRSEVSDNLALFVFFKLQFLFDIAKPFVLARTISKFSWSSVKSQLPLHTSRHWIKIILCFSVSMIGELFIIFKVVFDTFNFSPFPEHTWALSIFILVSMMGTGLRLFTSSFTLLLGFSILETISSKVNSSSFSVTSSWVLIQDYEEFDKSFGEFLYCVVMIFQLQWLILFHFAITGLFDIDFSGNIGLVIVHQCE